MFFLINHSCLQTFIYLIICSLALVMPSLSPSSPSFQPLPQHLQARHKCIKCKVTSIIKACRDLLFIMRDMTIGHVNNGLAYGSVQNKIINEDADQLIPRIDTKHINTPGLSFISCEDHPILTVVPIRTQEACKLHDQIMHFWIHYIQVLKL